MKTAKKNNNAVAQNQQLNNRKDKRKCPYNYDTRIHK